MATKSDLQLAARNWNTRITRYTGAGIPQTAWKPLLQRDFQGIMAGHSPIGERELNDAVYAGAGHPIVTDPHKGHDWTDILGNIPSDVQNLVTGFLPGVAHYIQTLPEQAQQVKALAGFSGADAFHRATQETGIDFGDTSLGGILRNAARTPVFNFLVPGLHTAANVTNEQGRNEIIEHPVSSLVDVGTAFSMLGEAGAFGRAAGAAEEAARTTFKAPEYSSLLNGETTPVYLRDNVYSHPDVNLPKNTPLIDIETPFNQATPTTGRLTDAGREFAPKILNRLGQVIPELKRRAGFKPIKPTPLTAGELGSLEWARSNGVFDRSVLNIDPQYPIAPGTPLVDASGTITRTGRVWGDEVINKIDRDLTRYPDPVQPDLVRVRTGLTKALENDRNWRAGESVDRINSAQLDYAHARIAQRALRKAQFVDEHLRTDPTTGEPVPPTALGALQQGQAFKAAGRIGLKGAELIPGTSVTRANLRQFFLDQGVHPDIVNRLSRPYFEIRNRNLAEMNKFMISDVVAPILKMKQDAPERILFNNKMGGRLGLTDDEIAMIQRGGPMPASVYEDLQRAGLQPTAPENLPVHFEPGFAGDYVSPDAPVLRPMSEATFTFADGDTIPAENLPPAQRAEFMAHLGLTDEMTQRPPLVAENMGGLPVWPELKDRFGNPVEAPLAPANDILSRAMPEPTTTPGTGIYDLTPEGEAALSNRATDEALRVALQKVKDEARFETAVLPGTDISLKQIGTRASRYMDALAKNDPNLVAVRERWEEPFGKEYYYHKSHDVAQAWTAQVNAFQEVTTAESIAGQARQAAMAARRAYDDARASRDLQAMASASNHLRIAGEAAESTMVKLRDTMAKATAARNEFYRQFSTRAPASMYGILGEKVRSGASAYARGAVDRAAGIQRQIDAAEQEKARFANRPSLPPEVLQQLRTLDDQIAELHTRLAKEGPQMPLPQALNRIQEASDTDQLAQAIGRDQAYALMNETEATWRALATTGVDPIFLPNAKASRLEHVHVPTVLSESPEAIAHMSKNTAFNLSRSVYDVAVGLVESKRQQLTESGTRELAQSWVKPWTNDSTTASNEISDGIRNGGSSMLDIQRVKDAEIDRHYVEWDPNDYGMGAYFPSVEGQQLLLPKGIADALRRLGREENAWRNPLRANYDKVMKVWRFSVLTTPRHMSHVMLGGMMMGMLRNALMPAQLLTQFREALAIMRGEDNVLKARFGGNLNDFELDQLQNLGSGKSIGRIGAWLRDHHVPTISGGVRKVNIFEDATVQMYKITQMLAEEKSLAKQWDVPVSLVRDEAISRANKMFVDMNAMTPFERTTIRKVFPFYGFTRHLFRYLMTYPADHPYAAAILTNFAVQHETDWKSGLPRDLSFMFFLGEPDTNGNVNEVDYRSIDPFRSFYNVFTLAGVTSQMNPGFQLLAEQAGVNVLSATSELYPHTHYNPNTGQMEADQPPGLPMRILETLVPPTAAIDAKFLLSDQFRNLKISDPEGYKHRLYTALGIPFSGFPFTLLSGEVGQQINQPRKIETAQLKRFTDASNAINEAIRTGDFTNAQRYDVVPVPTMLQAYLPISYASPQIIESVYRGLQQRFGVSGTNVSLHAVLAKPTRRRTR